MCAKLWKQCQRQGHDFYWILLVFPHIFPHKTDLTVWYMTLPHTLSLLEYIVSYYPGVTSQQNTVYILIVNVGQMSTQPYLFTYRKPYNTIHHSTKGTALEISVHISVCYLCYRSWNKRNPIHPHPLNILIKLYLLKAKQAELSTKLSFSSSSHTSPLLC